MFLSDAKLLLWPKFDVSIFTFTAVDGYHKRYVAENLVLNTKQKFCNVREAVLSEFKTMI